MHYLGIDISKKSFAVSILDKEGEAITKIAAGSPTPCGWGGKRRPASVSELDKSIPLVI